MIDLGQLYGSSELVLRHALGYQYLSGLLIGMGVGGVVGASTLGVAMFSLVAPEGHLKDFTAVVPVVNCVSNIATISVYVQHADYKLCMRMWPFILFGIVIGTGLLPHIPEDKLRRLTSVVYGCILIQRLYEKAMEVRAARANEADNKKNDKKIDGGSDSEVAIKAERERYYNQAWVSATVSIMCGVITVITNNSGPIFNIYLLACGLNMDQFVASRAVMMAGKNVAKVGARFLAGGLSWQVVVHGLTIGSMAFIGVQVAKPIKARTSPECYVYFTWCVLAYTCVKMWDPIW